MSAKAVALTSCLISIGTVSEAQAYKPLVNYQLQCMGCHLSDGSGENGRVPSVRESLPWLTASPEGRRFVIQIPGVAQSPLSDDDTAILLNWMVRNLTAVPVAQNFMDFTADEVSRYRLVPLIDVHAIRKQLLRLQSQRKVEVDSHPSDE